MQRITPQITILKKIFRFWKKSSRHCSIVLLSLQQTYAVNTIAMDRHIKALIILIIQYLCFHFISPIRASSKSKLPFAVPALVVIVFLLVIPL